MAASAEKIKQLLGNGLSNEVVATAVGVHPSYISQLMADEVFSAEVISLRTTTLASFTQRDRSWDSIEDQLLHKLSDAVSQDMIYKPRDVLNALRVVNSAKRRSNTNQDALVVNRQVVTLNLPTVIVNSYKKTVDGEVVEVTREDGEVQTLVTMPAASLMQQLAEKHQGSKRYDKVRKFLPSGSEKTNIEG